MEIKWLRKAIKNLDEIYDYLLVNANEDVAHKVVSEILKVIQLLVDNLTIGRMGRVPGTRELVLKKYPYLVPYRIKKEQIHVLRVFHVSQNPPNQW